MFSKIKYLLIVVSAVVSSFGCYPYAKAFATTLLGTNLAADILAAIFIPTAMLANIALGVYSLHNFLQTRKQISISRGVAIAIISLIAAMAWGFMCFVGYSGTFSIQTNLLLAFMVTLVNGGINFSAINSITEAILKKVHSKSPIAGNATTNKKVLQTTLNCVAQTCALFAALSAYLACTNGFTTLLNNHGNVSRLWEIGIYCFSLLIWFPTAILFANATRVVMAKLFEYFEHKCKRVSLQTVAIIIFAGFSASAFAQMSIEFFDHSKSIPEIFKIISQHNNFVFYIIMPLSFIMSALLNSYALNSLMQEVLRRMKSKKM
jgi:hypothetical protein